MMLVGIVFAITYWFFEALMHATFFDGGSIFFHLIPYNAHEFWMRSSVSGLFIVFGVYAHFVVQRIRIYDRERERLQNRLEESLAKALSKFLPLCAKCKSINQRGDEWIGIEEFIRDINDKDFTRSLCPGCSSELYEFFKLKKEAGM